MLRWRFIDDFNVFLTQKRCLNRDRIYLGGKYEPFGKSEIAIFAVQKWSKLDFFAKKPQWDSISQKK